MSAAAGPRLGGLGPRITGPLKAALTARLVAELPGLVVAEPTAVDTAIGVCADVLGATLALARLGCTEAPDYCDLVARTMMRADRVARTRAAEIADHTLVAAIELAQGRQS